MKINTLNTLSQNNPAFGVRIPIKEATISKLKDQIAEKPQLPADGSILGRIYYKIMNTKQENSSLISFFHAIASSNKKLKKLLEKSGKTLECAFWETCDKFFDVQLVANDKDKNIDNITDDKIKEDDYLTRIFHPIKNIEEKRKQIIEYCIKNYSEAKDNRDEFCEKIKDELNLDMQANSIQISILGPILRLPEYYNDFKNAIQKEEPTFTEFKEYLKKKAFYDNNKFYNSGNGELLEYTIETFKKYVPEFKEEFVFAEETQANNNSTIADAGTELLLYALKKLRAINKTTNDSTIEKNNDTTQTNINPRANIKRTHELDSSEPKAMDNFTNCFDTLIKVAQLNSPKDNTKQNNDTTQTNINTRASIKRTHVTKPLDIDKTCFNSLLNADKILKGNESEVFNTKETPDGINMFEAKRQHVIPNQGAPILPNLNNKTVIPMPKAINNNEKNDITVNEKRPHLFKQSPLEDNNEVDNNFSIYDGRSFFTKFAFSQNNVPLVINYAPQAIYNDNKSIKEKDDSQSNYDETTPLIGHDDGMLYGTSFFNDNIPQFNNNNTDFFTDLENLFPLQPSNTNALTSFNNIDIDKVSSNKNLLPNSNNQIGLSSENSSSGNINAEFFKS